jgi:tRNA-Thr(GGU) m(6)t(6)A37 methyltransferase TsaA
MLSAPAVAKLDLVKHGNATRAASSLAWARSMTIRDHRSESLLLEPIGIVHTSLATKVEAARQPRAAGGVPGRIELFPGRNFEHALEDLDGWEYIWVIFWFHLNRSWRPKVLPPRSRSGRKGVFSTRSPHRPNPLGLSAVRLERVDGLTLFVRDVDLVDGTPVLDIKPYVPYTDAHPHARSGWLEDAPRPAGAAAPPDPISAFEVHLEPLAAEQFAWIEARTGLAIRARVQAALGLGPAPHPYRRIRRDSEGFRLAIKDWRIRFEVSGRAVTVLEVLSGYKASQLSDRAQADPAIEAHRAFVTAWPRAAPPPR